MALRIIQILKWWFGSIEIDNYCVDKDSTHTNRHGNPAYVDGTGNPEFSYVIFTQGYVNVTWTDSCSDGSSVFNPAVSFTVYYIDDNGDWHRLADGDECKLHYENSIGIKVYTDGHKNGTPRLNTCTGSD